MKPARITEERAAGAPPAPRRPAARTAGLAPKRERLEDGLRRLATVMDAHGAEAEWLAPAFARLELELERAEREAVGANRVRALAWRPAGGGRRGRRGR